MIGWDQAAVGEVKLASSARCGGLALLRRTTRAMAQVNARLQHAAALPRSSALCDSERSLVVCRKGGAAATHQ